MKTLIKSDGLASPLSPSDLHGLRLADDTNKRRKQSRRLAVVTSSNPLCRSRGRRSGLLGSADVDYQCAGDDCRRETMCDACWSYVNPQCDTSVLNSYDLFNFCPILKQFPFQWRRQLWGTGTRALPST